jgi:hypothetical protein
VCHSCVSRHFPGIELGECPRQFSKRCIDKLRITRSGWSAGIRSFNRIKLNKLSERSSLPRIGFLSKKVPRMYRITLLPIRESTFSAAYYGPDSLSPPYKHGGQADRSQEVARQLIITRGDASEVLEPVKGTLDPPSKLIQPFVELHILLGLPAWFRARPVLHAATCYRMPCRRAGIWMI